MRLEELHRFCERAGQRVGGTLRWNVLGLWQGIQQGLAAAASTVSETRIREHRGRYLGSRLCADDRHRTNCWACRGITATDRTTGMLASACERVPREEIFAATGLQFMEINTLYQLLAMKRDHPELLDRATAAAADPRLLSLAAVRQPGGRIHQRHHDPVLRPVPQRLGE